MVYVYHSILKKKINHCRICIFPCKYRCGMCVYHSGVCVHARTTVVLVFTLMRGVVYVVRLHRFFWSEDTRPWLTNDVYQGSEVKFFCFFEHVHELFMN
jgi:hypothetical protein